MRKGLSKTLPGLKNFYMTGQWAGLIGVYYIMRRKKYSPGR